MKGRIVGRVLLALASLSIALAGAEGVYRARASRDEAPDAGDDEWYVRYRRLNDTLYRRSTDPELIYEPVPGAALEMEYGQAEFDAHGLREDREISMEPAAGRTRVAILGDSLVWGEFLAVSDAVPRRTEEALGAGFQVLNAGVTGYATTQEARWYEVAVRPLRPRVVVLVYCMNDMLIMSGPFERFATGSDRAAKDAQDAFFEREAPVRRETIDDLASRRERESTFRVLARALGVWERWRFADHYVDEYLIVADDPERRARITLALSRLGATIRADGAVPVLFVSPVLEEWDAYRWSELHDFVGAAGEQAGFRVHDPLDAFRREHEAAELRMGSDNLHYGQTGSRVFGAVIADAVREALQ